jgi:aspartate racemase
MKTVGIIGGLGPETTSEFYLEVSFECFEKNKEQRPPILIWNVPQRYDIEKAAQVEAKGEEKYVPFLTDAAHMLEKAGADFLVMPCNTLHLFIEDIRKSVDIPVLSIIEETVAFLKKNDVSKVGLLATPSIVKNNLYGSALAQENIDVVLPDDFDQAKVGKMINNIVLNRHNNKDRNELIKIIEKFEGMEVKHVILACTDLQILIPEHHKLKIFDTMKIFVDATVEKILE